MILNDEEEKIIKGQVGGSWKKNKVLKRQKKADKEKIEEVEFWQQLKTVNKEFKNINNVKKRPKKCQKLC